MNSVALKDLKPKLFFSKPLFLDEGYILLVPETPVDEGLVKRLTRWEFRETLTAGLPIEEAVDDPAAKQGEKEADGSGLPDGAGDKERIERILSFYIDFTAYMENLYTRFVTKTELDYNALSDRMKSLCQVIAEDRRFLLRAQSLAPQHKNYQIGRAHV